MFEFGNVRFCIHWAVKVCLAAQGNRVHLQSKHFCSINQKAWHPFTIYQEELELELKTSINEEDNQNKKIQDLEDINSYLQNANEVIRHYDNRLASLPPNLHSQKPYSWQQRMLRPSLTMNNISECLQLCWRTVNAGAWFAPSQTRLADNGSETDE